MTHPGGMHPCPIAVETGGGVADVAVVDDEENWWVDGKTAVERDVVVVASAGDIAPESAVVDTEDTGIVGVGLGEEGDVVVVVVVAAVVEVDIEILMD